MRSSHRRLYTILTHLLIGWLLVLALTAPSVVPNSLPARVGKALAPALAQAQSETIYYVDATRPDDSGDGLSWENAKRTLQAALALATDGAQIWVPMASTTPTKAAVQLPMTARRPSA